jgi:menaquinone-dependent protoporphyrinogen oxidase
LADGVRSTVLIAYATKHGSTKEVADAIAERLGARGIAVFTRPAREVTDLDGYEAVVVGSAIYMGRLHTDARDFLHRFERRLAVLPVAVFAMGPRTTTDEEVASSRDQLEAALAKLPRLAPCTTAIFGGVFDPDQHHFPLNRLPASDVRDWSAIRAWGDEVAACVSPRTPASRERTEEAAAR